MKVITLGLLLLLASPTQDARPQDSRPSPPITGQVVDAQGRPVAGARYRTLGQGREIDGQWSSIFYTGLSRTLTTDEQGRFSVTVRPDPDLRYDLVLEGDGKAPVFLEGVEPGADLRVVLLEGRDVAGQVVREGGEGISHMCIGMQLPNARGEWYRAETYTDDQGTFRFPGFLDGDGWQLLVGGAPLPLEANEGEVLDDLLVEIRLSRSGR